MILRIAWAVSQEKGPSARVTAENLRHGKDRAERRNFVEVVAEPG
jgi:hypothetical protein